MKFNLEATSPDLSPQSLWRARHSNFGWMFGVRAEQPHVPMDSASGLSRRRLAILVTFDCEDIRDLEEA